MSSDLQARVRLDAAAGARGIPTEARRPDGGMGEADPSVVILDLDQLGAAGVARWAGQVGPEVRLLGFYSHIDTELGASAERHGIEAIRRGRFWKLLPEKLTDP